LPAGIVRCFVATPAALNLFRRAAALAAGESDKAELLTRISGVLVQLGQFAEADALLEQALDQARRRGRAP
jgi:hypothetical protein